MAKLYGLGSRFLQQMKDNKMRKIISTFLKSSNSEKLEGEDLRNFLVLHRSMLLLRYKTKYKKDYIGFIDGIFKEFIET